MSQAASEPSGAANPPPDWLSTVALPLGDYPNGETFVRIHRKAHPPIFYSPGQGKQPLGRFDSAAGRFGVLYMAVDLAGAFVETVLRNPQRRLVAIADIENRSLSVLACSRALRLVELHGAGLQRLGVDNAITTGPYTTPGLWADALYSHPDRPDGICYASRHDPDSRCVALFERADLEIMVASEGVPLMKMSSEVAAVLRRYGKGLEI